MIVRNTVTLLGAAVLVLAGCTPYQGQNEAAGRVVGGLLGGAVGSQIGGGHGRTAAIIAGTLLGSHVGSRIGITMDEVDRRHTAETLETVRTGVPSTWRNPDSNTQYTVVPTRTYSSNSMPCREYTVDAVIGGQNEKVYGTACRTADGNWQVQN